MKENIAVYGTGVIGSCEATLTTGNGYPTLVVGHTREGMIRCRKSVEQNWDDLIAENLAGEENKEAAMRLLTITDDPSVLKDAGFVFEAVTEDAAVKEEVYRTTEKYCGRDVVIASCTSSLSTEQLAPMFRHPERFLVAHPFQPVHMLPLVEVVRHEGTGEEALEKTLSLLTGLHRQVVVLKKSVPGFIVNRLAQALFRESIYLIEQGVTTAEDIDRAVKYAVGMRYSSIGLLEYFDAVGFDLEKSIAENVYPDLYSGTEIQDTVLEGIESGHTGQAAGYGLYDWSEKDQDDFRLRKQAPYFDLVKEWDMPG